MVKLLLSTFVIIFFNLLGETNAQDDVYTPPPKTEECLQRERTEWVIKLYEGLANITDKQLFVLTRKDADNFKNLIQRHEQIRRPKVRRCRKKLPRFASCKIEEVSYILKKTTCSQEERPQIQPAYETNKRKYHKSFDEEHKNKHSSRQFFDSRKDEIDYHHQNHHKTLRDPKQHKRSHSSGHSRDVQASEYEDEEDEGMEFDDMMLDDDGDDTYHKNNNDFAEEDVKNEDVENDDNIDNMIPGKKIRNADGSITEIRACMARASKTRNGNHRLTKECAATRILPTTHFPRYLNEVLCDFTDSYCISREGAGFQRVVKLNFKRDTKNLGKGRLGDWEDYTEEIRTSCSCQLLPQSIFKPLI